MLYRDNASFRDPDGYVARSDDHIYRVITNRKAPILLTQYREFFETATQSGLMLDFCRNFSPPKQISTEPAIIPVTLPLVTYPYEWSFSQLKDAALVTIELNLLALKYGLTLKDASAFNVQQYQNRMLFIDHLSFEVSNGIMPWRPYSQFCRHFLYPLAVAVYRDFHVNGLFQVYLDGLSGELATSLLPLQSLFRPSYFVHIFLHNIFVNKSKYFEKKHFSQKQTKKQSDLLLQLKDVITNLNPGNPSTTWANYYNDNNYDDTVLQKKIDVINRIFSKRKYDVVWDIGANDGRFSRLIARYSNLILSLDFDHNAINRNYVEAKSSQLSNIAPLVFDVTSPSPNIGFDSSERTSLETRSRPDALLALALIHHLCVFHNIPFEYIAGYFRRHNCDLVIEFVDREDSQFQRLIRTKNVHYDWYTRDNFEKCFIEVFEISDRINLLQSHRSIYVMKPNSD